ncbi:MAG: lmo0937 family membrane protein [Syntrophales bacterium]
MLWTVSAVLIILWMLGMVSGYATGDYAHIILFFAIIVMLIQIEDDCRDCNSGYAMKTYLKRQLKSRHRKILPKLTIAGEKVSQTIIPSTTYRKE